ncbi:MAG: PorP/SprF family type IX secretion system membrane protein [Chitinophagaceae bacterium]
MKKFLCLLFISILCSSAFAQDPNFSQFFASPLTLNPALTGKIDGLYRIAGNYRNQWPTINKAYTTATVSFDADILQNTLPPIDQFGVGIMAFTDKSGNGALQNNYLGVSTAYHKGLDEDAHNQLGIGFQATYVNKRLDITNLKFEDQLRSDGFTGITSEIFSQNQVSLSYFDLNAGILYNGTTNGYNNFYLGASMYHITRPKESFRGGEYFLQPRLTIQAGGSVPYGEYDAIHISANHSRQANATNTTIGGAYSLNLNVTQVNPTNLYLGSWYRFGDAIVPYVGLEFSGFRIGATYDVNLSGLKPASNVRGGAELSLIYIKQPVDPLKKKLNCPKF